jgi:hypothetical protein
VGLSSRVNEAFNAGLRWDQHENLMHCPAAHRHRFPRVPAFAGLRLVGNPREPTLAAFPPPAGGGGRFEELPLPCIYRALAAMSRLTLREMPAST